MNAPADGARDGSADQSPGLQLLSDAALREIMVEPLLRQARRLHAQRPDLRDFGRASLVSWGISAVRDMAPLGGASFALAARCLYRAYFDAGLAGDAAGIAASSLLLLLETLGESPNEDRQAPVRVDARAYIEAHTGDSALLCIARRDAQRLVAALEARAVPTQRQLGAGGGDARPNETGLAA